MSKKEINLDSHKEDIARLAELEEFITAANIEKEQLKEKIQADMLPDSVGLIDGKKIATLSIISASTTVSFNKLPEDMQKEIVAAGLATHRKETTALRLDWKNIETIINESTN